MRPPLFLRLRSSRILTKFTWRARPARRTWRKPFFREFGQLLFFPLKSESPPFEQFSAPRCLSLHAAALAFRRTFGSIPLSRTGQRDLFAREVHFCPRRARLSFPHASQLRQGDRRGEQCRPVLILLRLQNPHHP